MPIPHRPIHRVGVLALGLTATACLDLPDALPPLPDSAVDGRPGDAPDMAGDAPDMRPPPPEVCNALDDDGDQRIDEGLVGPAVDDRPADDPTLCRPLVERCVAGERVVGPDRYARDETACDGLDNDCDGAVDENHDVPCVWCDGTRRAAPCNGCGDRIVVPPGFVCIPPGRFTMGSSENDPDSDLGERPPHTVVFERPYLITGAEVSQGAWIPRLGDRVSNPAWFSEDARGRGRACPSADPEQCPLERMSWFDALWFANEASRADGRGACYTLSDCDGTPLGGCADDAPDCVGDYACAAVDRVDGCTGYGLPTEAEWERAARGGTDSRYWTGDDTDALMIADSFRGNAEGQTRPPTAGAAANPFGLIDVHGNVEEWVYDGYTGYPDPPQTRVEPVVDEGPRRISRGGSWNADPPACRSAARHPRDPRQRSAEVGLRLTLPARPAPYEIRGVDSAGAAR